MTIAMPSYRDSRSQPLMLLACACRGIGTSHSPPTSGSDIESIIKDYLIAHPEVLQDAMAELEKRQQQPKREKHARRSSRTRPRCFNSPHQVVLGNPQGNVTVVEFFDYNCGFCKRAMADMLDLLKTDHQS